jgi:hypothetical protein
MRAKDRGPSRRGPCPGRRPKPLPRLPHEDRLRPRREGGENPVDSVRREIFEETGLHVEEPSIIGAYTSRYGDEGKWTVDVAFHCQASPGDLSLSAESSDAAWVSIEQMPPLAFAGERSALEEPHAWQSAPSSDVYIAEDHAITGRT